MGRDVRQQGFRVDVDGVAARRLHDRHAGGGELVAVDGERPLRAGVVAIVGLRGGDARGRGGKREQLAGLRRLLALARREPIGGGVLALLRSIAPAT